jgi:hypothetical protein
MISDSSFGTRPVRRWRVFSAACFHLVLKQEGEVVEADRRVGMLAAERLFAGRQCIAKKLRGLGVCASPKQIAACPPQKLGPARNNRGVIVARITPRQQMRRKLGAQ